MGSTVGSIEAVTTTSEDAGVGSAANWMTPACDDDGGPRRCPAKLPAKRKKKKKKMKRTNPSDSPVEDYTGPCQTMAHVGPPSKKRLRKLRYQQSHSSPVDYLVACAQVAQQAAGSSVVQFMADSLVSSLPSHPSYDQIKVITSISTDDGLRFKPSYTIESCADAPTNGTLTQQQAQRYDPASGGKGAEDDNHSSAGCGQFNDAPVGLTIPKTLTICVRPLLVLDLNGILCHRHRYCRESHIDATRYPLRPSIAQIANTPIIPRIGLSNFLSYLHENFCLAIWTSAKAKTASVLIRTLIPPEISRHLLFVWAQHHCSAIRSQSGCGDETLYEKDLKRVWKEYPLWGQHNTLLVDDSPEKCGAWRENAVHPPPLNGRIVTVGNRKGQNSRGKGDAATTLLPDCHNEKLQQKFFSKLVKHWKKYPLTQTWDSSSEHPSCTTSRQMADFLTRQCQFSSISPSLGDS